MSETTTFSLLKKFCDVRTGDAVRNILLKEGDFPEDVILGEVFGGRFAWLPVGGRTTNVSTVELATHPGRSIVERINNSIDALIESKLTATPSRQRPQSPTQAAEVSFGRPLDSADRVKWFDEIDATAEANRLSVVVLNGESREQPRLDVFDGGAGILSSDFAATILSLNVENKIKVPHALGMFGQGGSSSFAFASHTLILSRSRLKPEQIGFTIVRRCEIRGWKESCYAYLSIRKSDGTLGIPVAECDPAAEFQIYQPTGDKNVDSKLPALINGTLVRHFDYKLPGMSNALSSSQKNLYHALHYLLFDSLLPYRITDLRDGSLDTRHAAGSRNRLMKLVQKSKEKTGESRMELKHYHAMEYIAPPGSNDPCIGIEWWVPFSWRKESNGTYDLRSGTEQFVDRDHPILFTFNGQNHGELTGDCLRKLGLNLLRRHMVIHVDVSNADGNTKRELFNATRENLKKSTVLDIITARIMQLLADDVRLFELEEELKQRALASASKGESEGLKTRVIDLLREHGLQVGTRLGVRRRHRPVPGGQGTGGLREELPALPTLPFPDCTRFDVVRPKDGTVARLGESKSVWIETDAADEFDQRGLVQIRCTPALLEITHKTPLRGGRMKWMLAPTSKAKPGEKGAISVSLRVPEGSGSVEKFVRTIAFEIAPARPGVVEELIEIPDIEIVALAPSDTTVHETWRTVWPDADPSDAKASGQVAYRVFRNGKTVIYFNAEFPVYRAMLDKWKTKREELCKLFADEYKLNMALHAVMQAVAKRPDDIDLEIIDRISEQERALAATMIARHADTLVGMRQKGWVEQHG